MPNLEPTPPAEVLGLEVSEDKTTITLVLRKVDGDVYTLIYPVITEERGVGIGAGIRAPEHIELRTAIDVGDVTLRAIPRAGGFHARAVTLEAHDDAAVTSDALRAVPVGRVLQACRYALDVTEVPSLVNTTWILEELGGYVPEWKRREWPGGNLKLVLDTVALQYRIAAAVGDAPTQSVAASFGVSRATASRMIAKARAAKLLEEADRQWTGGNTRPRK